MSADDKQKPSRYRAVKAYRNDEFLGSRDARALRILSEYLEPQSRFDRLDVKGRRLVVAAMPGDRRDQDIAAAARELAGHFDHYFLKPDDDRRGRGKMEVPDMLKGCFWKTVWPRLRSP